MKKIIFSTLLLLVSFSSFSQDDDGFKYVVSSVNNEDYYVYIETDYGNDKELWVKYYTPIKKVKGKNGKIIKKGGGHSIYSNSIILINLLNLLIGME